MNSTLELSFLSEAVSKAPWREYFESRVYLKLACAIVAVIFWISSVGQRGEKFKAPFVGYRKFWEPAFLVRLRFFSNGWETILEGYEKYKDGMFWIRRNDADLLIVSNKYVEEIRSLDDSKVGAIEASIMNLLGSYSATDIALESNLHSRSLQQLLTPNIGLFVDLIRDEMEYSLGVDMPAAEDWIEVSIADVLLRIITRISARVFVGFPLCRNEEWLKVSDECTTNVFTTVLTLRTLPSFLHPFHPLIVRFVPAWYRLHDNLRVARKLLIPEIEAHRQLTIDEKAKQEPTLLKWMNDNTINEIEARPDKLAQRTLILGMGSIHTIKLAASQIIYDLCAHPQFIPPLRDELTSATTPDGKPWDKPALDKLSKLDSFMSESQRVNPPNLLAFHRLIKSPLRLSTGEILPTGTRLAVPAAFILLDPTITPNPSQFDPWRSYRERQLPDQSNLHKFAMTDKNHLHFSHGKHACPGRAMAVNELKLIVGGLVLGWDLRFRRGEGRPRNVVVDEYVFPDPRATVEIRRRVAKRGGGRRGWREEVR